MENNPFMFETTNQIILQPLGVVPNSIPGHSTPLKSRGDSQGPHAQDPVVGHPVVPGPGLCDANASVSNLRFHMQQLIWGWVMASWYLAVP